MPESVADILRTVLALPMNERVELMELIAASIPTSPSSLHPEWASELRRRAAEIDSGLVASIPWEEVRGRIQSLLNTTSNS